MENIVLVYAEFDAEACQQLIDIVRIFYKIFRTVLSFLFSLCSFITLLPSGGSVLLQFVLPAAAAALRLNPQIDENGKAAALASLPYMYIVNIL